MLAGVPVAPGDYPTLRTVMVGGDSCPASLADRWAPLGPGFHLYNCFGPTETTIY